MEHPSDIVVQVEFWQSELYQKFGREIETFEDVIMENVAKHINDQTLNTETKQSLIQFYRLWKTTKYQDPIILGAILGNWHHIKETVISVWPEKNLQSLNNILFATIPLPILNGLISKDRAGRHALIFQDGLRFFPTVIGFAFSSLFVQENSNALLITDYGQIDSVVENEPERSSKLIGYFVKEIITEGSIQLDDDSLNSLSSSRRKFINYFAIGFNSFVCAHEVSHCINNHCDQSPNDKGSKFLTRDIKALSSLDKRHYEQTGNFLDVTDKQIMYFMHYQLLENLADAEALITILKMASDTPEYRAPFFLGALSFFWCIELNERIQHAIKTNGDDLSVGKKVEDYDMYNLLFRRTHPAPLSRFEKALHYVWSGKMDIDAHITKDMMNDLIFFYHYLSTAYECIWKDNAPTLQYLIRTRSLTMGNKWLMHLPKNSFAFGVDGNYFC